MPRDSAPELLQCRQCKSVAVPAPRVVYACDCGWLYRIMPLAIDASNAHHFTKALALLERLAHDAYYPELRLLVNLLKGTKR